MAAVVLALLAGLAATAAAATPPRVRTTESFDKDWHFLKADAPGAEKPGFDDAAWRALNVPHDWSSEGPFDQNNRTGRAGGYLPSGIGWYRKHFTLPLEYARRRVFVEFEGVMANSDVWINGTHLGKRPYGYVSFRYELTGHVNFGVKQPNILAVRADNSAQPASRWYTGAGIYRHVWLIATDPVHIAQWATFVTTPQASAENAAVLVRSTVVNQSGQTRKVSLRITLFKPDGKAAATAETQPQTIDPGESADFEQDIDVAAPRLWNLDLPVIYRALTQVRARNTTLDDDLAPFGIREALFDAATGFWLNGKNFKIKGFASTRMLVDWVSPCR